MSSIVNMRNRYFLTYTMFTRLHSIAMCSSLGLSREENNMSEKPGRSTVQPAKLISTA